MDSHSSPDTQARLYHALRRLHSEPRVGERRKGERRGLRGFSNAPYNHERRFMGERRIADRRAS
jgi:hypothetical protein